MGFDPLSLGLMAVGTAVSAAGQMAAGEAQADKARYQAQVAENNKRMEAAAGAAREAQLGMKTRAEHGRLRAQMAASGVDVSSGSSSDVLDALANIGELDLATLRSNTAQAAYGYDTQKALYEAEEDAAKTAGNLGAFTSLISGATDMSKYKSWKTI